MKGAPEDVMHHAAAQAWMVVMVALGVLMLLLGFYHMRMHLKAESVPKNA